MPTSIIIFGIITLIAAGVAVFIIKKKKKENSGSTTITIKPDTSGRNPIKKALLVGINIYKPELGANLRGCVNDVENMHELLVNSFKFDPENIRVLVDERATKQGILDRLKWLFDGSKVDDELVFQFSGHGGQIRDRNGDELVDQLDEILIPHDLDWDDPLTDDYLAALFKQLPKGVHLTMLCDSCLSGETMIPLLDGTEKTIKQMAKEGGEFWVYSSKSNGEVIAGKAHSARITGKRKLIEIVLDNGKILECTDDHFIMMRDGSYKKAGKLASGDSLMPLYRREWRKTDSDYLKGYELVRTTNPKTNKRRWLPTHIAIRNFMGMKKKNSEKSICHHKNFNKRDNRPINLEMVTWEWHRKAHGKVGKENMKKLWKNKKFITWRGSKEYREQQSTITKKSWQKPEVIKAHINGVEKRLVREGRRYPKPFEKWNNSNDNIEHLRRMAKDKKINEIRSKKALAFWNSEKGEKYRTERLIRNHKKWHVDRGIIKKDCKLCCPNNHKVVSVKTTNKFEFVYDITVNKYHNFAISAGIFVHNCHSGSISRSMSEIYRNTSKSIKAPFDIRSRSYNRILPKNKM